jgi:hypothetical protein
MAASLGQETHAGGLEFEIAAKLGKRIATRAGRAFAPPTGAARRAGRPGAISRRAMAWDPLAPRPGVA